MAIQATITGNVGNVRINKTQTGKTVLGFSVAATPFRRDKETGEFHDLGEPLWVDVSLWERDADQWRDHIAKGVRVALTATLTLESYEASDGTPRTKIVATYPRMLGVVPPAGNHANGPAATTNGVQGGTAHDPWATGNTYANSAYDDAPPF